MTFDILTALFTISILLGFCFIIVVLITLYNRTLMPNYRFVMTYFLLSVIGSTILFINPHEILNVSIFAGFLFLFVANIILAHIITTQLNRSVPSYIYGIFVVLYMVLSFRYTYYSLNVGYQFVIYGSFNIILFAYTLILSIRLRSIINGVIVLFNTIIIIVNTHLFAFHLFNSVQTTTLTDHNNETIPFLIATLASIGIMIGIVIDKQMTMVSTIETVSTKTDLFGNLFQVAPMESVIIRQNGAVLECNQEFSQSFCKRKNKDGSCSLFLNFDKEDIATMLRIARKTTTSNPVRKEPIILHQKNKEVTYEFTVQRIEYQDDIAYILFFKDMTSELQYIQQITTYDSIKKQMQSMSQIGEWSLDVNRKIIMADDIARSIYELHEAPEQIPYDDIKPFVIKTYRPMMDEAINNLLENNVPYDVHFEIITPSGVRKSIHSVATIMEDSDSLMVIGTLQDITQFIDLHQEIEHLRHYDNLTKLANRTRFMHVIEQYNQPSNMPLSIIIGDLNNLTLINQTLGFESGNKALIESATVFRNALPENTLIARIGEDEYGVLLPQTSDEGALNYIQTLTDAFNSRYAKSSLNKITWTFGKASTKIIVDSVESLIADAMNDLQKNKSYYNQAKQSKSIDLIMKTLNEKDPFSEIHSSRVAYYAKRLATAAKLTQNQINTIETAALLHDIGKIIITDSILKKEGKLTDAEYEIIKQHPLSSYNILSSLPEMKDIAKIVLAHHERVDGYGYPYQITGKSIPIESKIITIADAYDAMTGQRRYRDAYVKEEAILELLEHRGTQFDADLVNIFIDEVLIKERPNQS